MKLPRWIAWLLHRLPTKAKAKAFDVAVDQMSKPEDPPPDNWQEKPDSERPKFLRRR